MGVSGITRTILNVTSRVARDRGTAHHRRAPVFQPHRAPVSNRRRSTGVPRHGSKLRTTNPTTPNFGTPRLHGPERFIPTQEVTRTAARRSLSSSSSCQAEVSSGAYEGYVEAGNNGNSNDDSVSADDMGDNVRDEVMPGDVSNTLTDHISDGEHVPHSLLTANMIALYIAGVINLLSDSDEDEMDVEDGVVSDD